MDLEKLGPFKIGRVLGRGGMGAVYEGMHETDLSAVAVKVLPDPLDEDAEVRLRFETEIETLKRLRHPNIVRLSGFGAEHGQLYYVMEFVDGPSLQQELRKKRLFQWYEVAKIGLDICQALRHAHDRGVIHRDIKPANILLDQEGNIKLSDFGIARFFGSQQITDMHSVIGTLEYMSPEQALANPINSSTDLYSLGCVLYALLTGKPPFPARSLPELLRKHQAGAPAPIHSIRHDVPNELEYIIADLLQIRPEDRPRNAFLVTKRLQSLLQALAGDPAEIKVLPMSPDTPKWHHESALPHELPASPPQEGNHPALPGTSPQGASHSGSFERAGEKHPVAVFPANVDPVAVDADDSGKSPKVSPLTETVTHLSVPDNRHVSLTPNHEAVHFPGGLRHGEVRLSNTQTLRPAKDEPLPEAAYWSKPSGNPNGTPLPQRQPVPQDAGEKNVPVTADTPVQPQKRPARFTSVADEGFDPFAEPDRAARPILSLPVVLTSTMLMLIGLTVYYLIQPVPPDVLYARITAAVKEGESADGYSLTQLRSAQSDILNFLSKYPNHPSAAQVRVYQDELDLSDHERRLERRMQFSTLRSLSPVERTYVNILSSSPADPEEMIAKLQAFIAVFQPLRASEPSGASRHASSPAEICVELARRRLKKLEQDVDSIHAEQVEVILRRLEEAAEGYSADPMRSEGIWRGIIELYQNNRWAKELVGEAKERLEK